MKAAVIDAFGSPLTIREIGTPSPGPHDVLIRVRACGLCGTDLKIASGRMPGISLPLTPGHEIAGEICQLGEDVEGVGVGDRVAVYFYCTCGRCRYCASGEDSLCENLQGQVGFTRSGGLEEFVAVPASNVLRLGDSITFPEAAVLADAVATPYHALVRAGALAHGDVLVVVGAGGLGLHAIQIGKVLGATVIATDVVEDHLRKARELGADLALDPGGDDVTRVIRERSEGRGADMVIDFVGQPETLERGLTWLGSLGKLMVVGYQPSKDFRVSSFRMIEKGLKIIGCRASTKADLGNVIGWVEEKRIRPVIDDILPLEEVNRAYERIRDGKVMGRLVIIP